LGKLRAPRKSAAIAREYLHLVGEELLLIGRQRVPILDRRRLGSELGVDWDHA